jgi:hypothetical protein
MTKRMRRSRDTKVSLKKFSANKKNALRRSGRRVEVVI